MGHSTTPAGVALQSHIYLAQGGVAEPAAAACAFSCDTLLMTGFGFAPAADHAELGHPRPGGSRPATARRSRCSTTAPSISQATPVTSRRCAAPSRTPAGRPLPVFCASLRTADAGLLDLLGTADAMVTTVLAAGGATPATGHGRRQRRQLERGPSRRAGHPDPAGPVPDQFPSAVAGQRRRAVAARRRHPGRRAGVRRAHHHGSVLVQGD